MRRVLLALLICGAATLQAQVRTWVSTEGVDTNPCTRALPCRNFDVATNAVATGGEVVALDSGGYGPVLVTKSVAIIAPSGIHAAIAPTTGAAITVNAGSSLVVLRGLYLNSQGALSGIALNSAQVLYIESCVVSGFSQQGLNLVVNFPGTGQVLIHDTLVRDSQTGLEARQDHSSGTLEIEVDRARFFGNSGLGMWLDGGTRSLIRNTAVDGNNAGIQVTATSSRPTVATFDHLSASENTSDTLVVAALDTQTAQCNLNNSLISGNGSTGIVVLGPLATLWLYNSTVTRNMGNGLTVALSATVLTYGNNIIRGNTPLETNGTIGGITAQ